MSDTTIAGSLVDGLVLHRAVTDATIRRTESTDNAVDGITIGRSSLDVSLIETNASENGRNGLSIDGRPLADGPNAVGTTVAVYGDTRVEDGSFHDNARYGVEVTGGVGIGVSRSDVSGNEVGIVVSEGADDVTVLGNTLADNSRQGISVRRSSTGVEVRDNAVSGGDTGVIVRESTAMITGNDFREIANHGVSLVGAVDGATVSGNSIAGFGSIAIWTDRSTGGVVTENRLRDWRPAPTLESVTRSVFQPLTLVWLALGLLVVVTALIGKRGSGVIRNPFAEQVPLPSRGASCPETPWGTDDRSAPHAATAPPDRGRDDRRPAPGRPRRGSRSRPRQRYAGRYGGGTRRALGKQRPFPRRR